MADEQIIELTGTKVDTLWTTVESGKLEDGTKYKKKQRLAPRTFEKAVQDDDGVLLSTKLTTMQQQISSVGGNVVGNMENLETESKETIVGAINEVNANSDTTLERLINSGILSNALEHTSINEAFTFEDLISKKEITFFTNWSDHTNFPELYGSGIFLPGFDTRCNSIIYTVSPTPHQKEYRHVYIGYVFVAEEGGDNQGLTTGVEWKQLMTNDEVVNPNLLINPDFRINQRGKTKYVGNIYGVDRWQGTSGSNITVVENGIKTECFDETHNQGVKQFIECNIDLLVGKSFTLSLEVDTTGVPDEFVNVSSKNHWFSINDVTTKVIVKEKKSSEIITFTGVLQYNTGVYKPYLLVRLNTLTGTIIKWAKLELGSVATKFIPPQKSSELIKCKYFYQEIIGEFSPYSYSDNDIYASIKVDRTMRVLPSYKFKNTIFNEARGSSDKRRGVAMISYWGGIHSDFAFSAFINGNEGNNIHYITVLSRKQAHGCMNNAYLLIGADNPLCLDAEIY